jgi:sarcosine oxidase
VIVGGGLLGLSAAWALARRGAAVVVLEAGDDVGHERSGSKGDARIFRLGYPERHYVQMAQRARRLWAELEARSGRTLLHATGQVTFGAEVESIAAALESAGAPFQRLSAREVASRFPGLEVAGPVLFEPESGVLAADQCLRALRDSGTFEVRTGVRVTALHQGDRDVSIYTAGGDELRASVVIDCAGPQALALVASEAERSGLVAAPPSLPQVAYFRTANGEHDATGLPVFIEWGPDMVYGLPVPATSVRSRHAGMYKVSHHTPGRPPLDPFDPSIDRPLAGDDPALLALLTSTVARLLPGLDPHPVATERCVYDNSIDSDFVIDRIGRVVVGCGTSGHGFKFGPLLGEMLGDLAMGTGQGDGVLASDDLRLFGLHRADSAPRPDEVARERR